jgi:hypothetical protein
MERVSSYYLLLIIFPNGNDPMVMRMAQVVKKVTRRCGDISSISAWS